MQERFDGIDTGMFADLLDGRGFEGAMTGLRPVWDGQRFHGPAFVVKMLQARVGTFSAEDIALGRILEAASPGDAIVIDAGGAPIAVWGELVALAAINKGVVGVVADAGVRDADILKELKFPVMSRHLSPAAGKTRLKVASMNEEPVVCGGVTVHPGDFIFSDPSGVVVCPKDLTEEVCAGVFKLRDKEAEMKRHLARGLSYLEAAQELGIRQV